MSEQPKDLKTLSSYMIGFIGSLLLTLLAFAVVGKHFFSTQIAALVLMALAVVQLFVQVTFFLRLNTSAEGRWNLMPFIFTIFVVLVVVIGSLWIMFNLNYNMMH